jgi:hypothetical protein
MRTARPRLALALAALLLALEATAQGAAAQGAGTRAHRPDFLQSDQLFAEIGALPDPLDLPHLEEAAFLASGVAPERLAGYRSRLDEILKALRAEAGGIADPAAKGEAVLTFLHKGPLKAYSENATTLDGVLDTGVYNCVSSAVLYILAAGSLGLDVEGVRTSDHAFCSLVVGNRKIDVETTNPYGFDPGNKKEFKDSFGRATGYAYVAPGGYGDRRAIGARSLVGLVLSNRASLLERAGRFAEATKLGADYDELCRDADSRAFLLDRVNNLVAALQSRRDFSGAEAAARAAAAALPGEPRLAELAATTLADLGEVELVQAANALPFADAVAAADRIFAAGRVGASRYAQAITAIYGNEAGRRGSAGDWLGAAALADAGIAKLAAVAKAASPAGAASGDGGLAQVAKAMRRNFVVEAHNRFARLYNSGDYKGAAAAIEEALASMPDDPSLVRDLAAAKAAMSG